MEIPELQRETIIGAHAMEGLLQGAGGSGRMKVLASRCWFVMAQDDFKAFLAVIEADASLGEKVKAASDVDAVIAIAQTAGFTLSAADVQASGLVSDLPESLLEGVAGGLPGAPGFGCW